MKRSQIAIETLMVYGAVILIVMLAIGALVYFGVLDLGSYLPDKCDIKGAGLVCESFSLSKSGYITIEVKNELGKNIESMTLYSCKEADANDVGNVFTGGMGCLISLPLNPPAGLGNNIINGELAGGKVFVSCPINSVLKGNSKIKLNCELQYKIQGGAITRSTTMNILTTLIE